MEEKEREREKERRKYLELQIFSDDGFQV